MATNSNVFSQGGGGTTYEIEVQTCFFINFLLGLQIPGMPGKIITLRQQSGSLGYHTDDLLLQVVINDTVNVLLQIKHQLTISPRGEEFKKVLSDAWRDFNNIDLFNQKTDKIFIIKSDLTQDEKKHLVVILDWARAKAETQDLVNEINRIQAKKHYWDLFKTVLKEAFSGQNIDEQSLHNFLKTLYFLEYDLGTDASTMRSSYLSLISKYKVNDLDDIQIWNQLYATIADGNSKGALYSAHDGRQEITQLFHLGESNRDLRSILQLSNQHMEILALTENRIGGHQVERGQLDMQMEEALQNSSIVILSGNPGSGKSALASQYLKKIKDNKSGLLLSFKADELSQGNLMDYFSALAIKLPLKTIFSLFAGSKDNIIYIDALEKLLEADGPALAQLLKLASELPGLKLLFSCRKANLQLLLMKYFDRCNPSIVDVNAFNDSEINKLSLEIPALQPLLKNRLLKSLMTIPKYLDFAHRALSSNYSFDQDMDEEGFKNALWMCIVEDRLNENKDGLPERRSQLFIQLAVQRSRSMKPFVELDSTDFIARERLLKNNIIIEYRNTKLFAPAHDVLEDWALIRYIDDLFGRKSLVEDFFQSMCTSPAIRRAYRLWVDMVLATKEQSKLKFITEIALSNITEDYFTEESLISILSSAYAGEFFESHSKAFQANNFFLLFRTIGLIRTACRRNIGDSINPHYIPTGNAWLAIIKILADNIEVISEINKELPYQFIEEWSNSIEDASELPEGTREAGLIMLHLINNYTKIGRSLKKDGDEEVKLLLRFAGGIKGEIKALLNDDDLIDNWEDSDERSLSVKIRRISLSGFPSFQMAKYLPETVIKLAKKSWMHTSCKVHYPSDEHEKLMFSLTRSGRSIEIEPHFGLRHEYGDLSCFPASAIQTPTYWLLKFNTTHALRFIVDISNWCADNYSRDEFAQRDDMKQHIIFLKDFGEVRQYGSDLLWSVYRGSVKVSPYPWQSILMALEKYLLEVCQMGISQLERVNQIIKFLLENSNSVAITGVVSSIYQAFPQFAGKYIAFLYAERDFLSYDISRFTHEREQQFLQMNPVHDKERQQANKFYDRKRYPGGLQGFISDYCFNYGEANLELFTVLDDHREKADQKDYFWRKRIDEMDIRTYRLTDFYQDEQKSGYLIEPSYAPDLRDVVKKVEQQHQKTQSDSADALWLINTDKGELSPDINRWHKIYRKYVLLKEVDIFRHKPGLLAKIGIESLWEGLTEQERDWCGKTVTAFVIPKIQSAYNQFSAVGMASPFDLDASIKALPVLVGQCIEEKDQDHYKLLLYFLTSPFERHDLELNELYKTVSEKLWLLKPLLANTLFSATINYAKFFNKHKKLLANQRSGAEYSKFEKLYDGFIQKSLIATKPLNLDDINFKSFSIGFLERAVKMIPERLDNPELLLFIKTATNLVIAHHTDDRKIYRQERLDYLRLSLQDKIAACILQSEGEIQQTLLNFVLESALRLLKAKTAGNLNSLWTNIKFFRDIVESVILKTDGLVHASIKGDVKPIVNQFINCWRIFIHFLVKEQTALFVNLLLLDISCGWKKTARNWKPIDQYPDFFVSVIKVFGESSPQSVINLLSHIGEEMLYGEGFKVLVQQLENTNQIDKLSEFENLELLVSKGYDHHLPLIRSDETLLDGYLRILDRLIKQNSTAAYWIREDLIVFRTAGI